jgi:diacylglycerol kinase (ATP)
MMRSVVILHNPAAGRDGSDLVNDVSSQLMAAGVDVSRHVTQSAGDIERTVSTTDRQTVDCIAVAGGDGSLMAAVNGANPDSPALAIIPTGTANVVSLEIGLPRHGKALAEIIRAGKTTNLSVGEANGRRFVFSVGAGFDAYVVATVSARLKRRLGKLAYGLAALRALFTYRFPLLDIDVDGQAFSGTGILVMKGSLYAGQHTVAPDRCLGQDDVSVFILREPGVCALFGYAVALLAGNLARHWNVVFIPSARHIRINGPDGTAFQVDGENAGILPLCVQAHSGHVRLVVPSEHD